MRSVRVYGYRVADRARRVWWFVRRPRTYGVKCVIVHDGRWLMIRNTYGRGHWTFAGGGVERGESPEEAVRREVREEVGIALGDVHPIGTYTNRRHGNLDTVTCFSAVVASPAFAVDRIEVAEARWFDPAVLPEFRSPAVGDVLALQDNA